jgi:hypothetical protein
MTREAIMTNDPVRHVSNPILRTLPLLYIPKQRQLIYMKPQY